jgi:hypothetical protein
VNILYIFKYFHRDTDAEVYSTNSESLADIFTIDVLLNYNLLLRDVMCLVFFD